MGMFFFFNSSDGVSATQWPTKEVTSSSYRHFYSYHKIPWQNLEFKLLTAVCEVEKDFQNDAPTTVVHCGALSMLSSFCFLTHPVLHAGYKAIGLNFSFSYDLQQTANQISGVFFHTPNNFLLATLS